MTPRHRRLARAVAAISVVAALWPVPAVRAQSTGATTAKALYTRAQSREATVRTSGRPADRDVAAAIAAYEAVVRRHPGSGYADNALWQAAGLAYDAFARTGRHAHKATGDRLLSWLTREYPASPFVTQAPARRAAAAAAPAHVTASDRPVAHAASKVAPSLPALAATPTGPLAMISSITREALPGGDRIVLQLDREVQYATDRITGPDRVFLDLTGATFADGVALEATTLKGMTIGGVRVGRPAAGTVRVVFDLAGRPRHSVYPLYGPYRLVLDAEGAAPPPLVKSIVQDPVPTTVMSLAPAPRDRAASPEPAAKSDAPAVAAPSTPTVSTPMPAAAPPTAPAPMPATSAAPPAAPNLTRGGDYSLARQLGLSVQRIVIDAGHGGHDPGAHGNGIIEKDLVLDVARRLKTLLEATPGVDVVLTRDTDVFIPLEERTAIANRVGADLFLSIHANDSARKDASGLETYFLNFATNPEAEAVAARENATSAQNMGHLPEIVKAITLNSKLAESREFATMVQTSLVRRLKVQNNNARDRGVKQAPFVVLIGAQMPSVLAEIAFVTNKGEANLLKQASYKQRIAQALADAIQKYQTSLKKVSTVAARNGRER